MGAAFFNGYLLLKCATYFLYHHVLSYHAYGGPLANFVKRIVLFQILYFCNFCPKQSPYGRKIFKRYFL